MSSQINTPDEIHSATLIVRTEWEREYGNSAMDWQTHVAYDFARETVRAVKTEALSVLQRAQAEGTFTEGASLYDWLSDHCENAFIYSLQAQVFCLGCDEEYLDAYKEAIGDVVKQQDAETIAFFALREMVQETEEYIELAKLCGEATPT